MHSSMQNLTRLLEPLIADRQMVRPDGPVLPQIRIMEPLIADRQMVRRCIGVPPFLYGGKGLCQKIIISS